MSDGAFLHLRQTATPNGKPQPGGNLLYPKSDGKWYTRDYAGTETLVGPIDTSTFATLTGTQTLTNKTLTSPRVNQLLDTDGDPALGLLVNAGTAVNYAEIRNGAAGSGVTVAAVGSDANINLTLAAKGVAQIFLSAAGVTYGGVNIMGAWTSYTPTVTASSGTFTTASAAMHYIQIGKTVLWTTVVTITTVGTAAGSVNFTLPVTPASPPAGAVAYIGSGRENAVTGKMLQVIRGASAAAVWNYDNTSPITAGASLVMSGSYEAA